MRSRDIYSEVTEAAIVPEQIISYVCAVSSAEPRMVGRCIGFKSGDDFVLVGYPLENPMDTQAMGEAVDESLKIPGLFRITVIGPAKPPQAPPQASSVEDSYYFLTFPPPPPSQKLRNMVRRANRDLVIETASRLSDDHLALIRHYMETRPLADGTKQILRELPRYLESSKGALLISARLKNGRVAAFAIGEFSAPETAFFMFCFRHPEIAPPGSTDFLLSCLLNRGQEQGHIRMNLGLGINDGVRFFKLKWGATPFLPYVETSWNVRPERLLDRLCNIVLPARLLLKEKTNTMRTCNAGGQKKLP